MMDFDAIKNPPLSYYVLDNEIEFDTRDFWSKYGFADEENAYQILTLIVKPNFSGNVLKVTPGILSRL